MITVTCKCGQTSATFLALKEKDFPQGWETDCCSEGKAQASGDPYNSVGLEDAKISPWPATPELEYVGHVAAPEVKMVESAASEKPYQNKKKHKKA